MKEFNNILEIYNFCADIINSNYNSIDELSINDKVLYFRNHIDKNILNRFFIVGNLSIDLFNNFSVNTRTIKLSVDSLIKNILEHPEISIKEYSNLPNYINNAEYILKKSNKNLIYFKIENNIYQFVIKKTKNGNELFITTFHKASINQLNKDLKRYQIINKKDSSDSEDSKYPSVT